MSENCSNFCRFADVGETCQLSVRKNDELVTVIAENARKRDCFSYRRGKDGHIIFEQFETGKVMRLLIVTHDAFNFYLGSFLVQCDRNDVITLCGGDVRANLHVHADTTVAVEKGQILTANTFVLRGAPSFVINGTLNATSVALESCGCIKGGTKEGCLHNEHFKENLCLNL